MIEVYRNYSLFNSNIYKIKNMEKDRVKKYKENVERLLKNCYSKEKE